MPRAFSSRRMTRARGHTEVRPMSVMRKRVGSSLLPVPMQLITGTPQALAFSITSSLAVTVSMASTT